MVDYLLSALSLKGAPRAPKTPKAEEKQEGDVFLDAELPPSWSDVDSDGGVSEGELGGGAPASPRSHNFTPKKAKKIEWLSAG